MPMEVNISNQLAYAEREIWSASVFCGTDEIEDQRKQKESFWVISLLPQKSLYESNT
jgi:hypothetical protein